MSIKVGFANDKYNYNNIIRQDNTLSLNSYINSNLIMLNTDTGTTSDALMVYKNRIATGLTNLDTYVIDDVTLPDKRLISVNSSNIELNRSTNIHGNIMAKNMFTVINSKVTMSSNVLIDLRQTGSFTITSNNVNIFKVDNNALECSVNQLNFNNRNKTMLQIDNTNMNINNNVYINNGRLYVNHISSVDGISDVLISGAKYTQTNIDRFLATKSITISQNMSEQDITPFEICKRYIGVGNIFNIYSCNLVAGSAPQVYYNLSLDRNGQLGIGTHVPDASLSIRTVSTNIIRYSGESASDSFVLNKRANVGIGTTILKGQLHIVRTDELSEENIRRTPMINCDMFYNPLNNNSNIYVSSNTTITPDTAKVYVKTNVVDNAINMTINNNFYLLNEYIYDNALQSDLNNLSKVQFPNIQVLNLPVADFQQPSANLRLQNNLLYPASDKIYIEEDSTMRSPPIIESISGQTIYSSGYVLFMMTKETSQKGGYNNDISSPNYNASNFTNYGTGSMINVFEEIVYTTINNYAINIRLNFIFENSIYPVTFANIIRTTVAAPPFMYASYNNNFISSLSSYGTLSLGTEVPVTSNQAYLLYAMGKPVYINTLRISSLDTENHNNSISMSDKNISDINNVTCSNIGVNNMQFNSASGSYLFMDNMYCSNLSVSNLSFTSATNNYLSLSESNIQFNTRVSIGPEVATPNSTCLKITVDNDLNAISNNLYTNHNGIILTNLTNTMLHPTLSVQTSDANCIPYVHLQNSLSSYYLRVIKVDHADNTSTNHFQIINNNLTTDSIQNLIQNNTSSHIMQHITEYNLLTFGEQNTICMHTSNETLNTNATSKISIGIPYAILGSQQVPVKYYPKYFYENIDVADNPYMLNIYGNVSIKNIYNNPVFSTLSTDNNTVCTAINGEPDNRYSLRVVGNISASNIMLDEIETLRPDKNLAAYLISLEERLFNAEQRILSLTQ